MQRGAIFTQIVIGAAHEGLRNGGDNYHTGKHFIPYSAKNNRRSAKQLVYQILALSALI